MWIYEKKLEYPVRVHKTDPRMAKFLTAQYGGPDSELSAAVRYLTQRYTMPTNKAKALLTDIGTEELAHWEIIATMIYQLLKDMTAEQMRREGLGDHFAEHDRAVYPADAAGVPWTAAYIQATGDPVTDLHEDMAAEQKARTTYEHLIRLTDDPGIKDTLRFLREREVVHFQRFGEALDDIQEEMTGKKIF
ncbi:manganese catalase family protein [Desulfotomaculum copahuensis]|uniref:Rubrerythrin family protein n=1 Tax=Desulfotomaculum copahuensis TaxID=1838280 RepID=A0A1B7LIR6_9FIRM|nr:manganese catalase family protein [Desulfotomaculum copahuensis]OAT86465.1 rubrerythrin family protein [Desulfotomaculum copahuensis]